MSAAVDTLTEPEVYRMPDGTETIYMCQICGEPFIPDRTLSAFTTCGKPECRKLIRGTVTCMTCGKTVPRIAPGQRTCGNDICRYSLRIATPEGAAKNRERCRRWGEEHRNVRNRNAWLVGQPIFGQHLPGGAMLISVSPRLRWPMEHRNVRGLHGLISVVLADGHTLGAPTFAIGPVDTRFGWGTFVWGDERARSIAGKQFDGRIFEQKIRVAFSPLMRIKSPKIERRGHRKLLIDAVTPVCSQSTDRTITRTVPNGSTIETALCNVAERLNITAFEREHVKVDVVSHTTQVGTVFLGDKYGVVRGWVGQIVVDTNAVGHWLLKVCETVGLGGRTAFGFGRVKVSEVSGG